MPGTADLPLPSSRPDAERADAARNRRRALAAAQRLVAERGVAAVTMDDVAAAAGVGKGTLYRRFGDKGGLAMALLGERERGLQQRLLAGDPPLGPGAEAPARLAAFVEAYVALVADQLDLVLLSETSSPGARTRTGVHAFWRQHCALLLRAARAPEPELRAELLLAGMAAEQVRAWLRDGGRDVVGLTSGLSSAALALARPGPPTARRRRPAGHDADP